MGKKFLIFLLSFLFLPQVIFAAGLVPCGGPGENPCTFCDFFKLFENIVKFVLFTLVPPLAILMLAFGGAMFFLATGNPGQLEKAKGILTSLVIGLFIIYTAWLLIGLFFTFIGVADWTGLKEGWFRIECFE